MHHWLAPPSCLPQMVSYVAYIIRGFAEQFDSFGERLILSALRLLQDLPANGIQARKVSTLIFSRDEAQNSTLGPHGRYATSYRHSPSQGAFATDRQTV